MGRWLYRKMLAAQRNTQTVTHDRIGLTHPRKLDHQFLTHMRQKLMMTQTLKPTFRSLLA